MAASVDNASSPREIVSRNLDAVRSRMRAACERAGRPEDAVQLVAVTKYAEMEWVRPLPELGVRILGESRPQQLVERAEQLTNVEWDLVGHLQRNKIRRTLPAVASIHSIDSWRLLEAVERIAGEEGHRPRVLIEVNLAGEASKNGFSPDAARDAWPQVLSLQHVAVEGLMTMPPLREQEDEQRSLFQQLRELRDELRDRSGGDLPLPELSMGTSHDFPSAILEGATRIRIGRTLFRGLRDA